MSDAGSGIIGEQAAFDDQPSEGERPRPRRRVWMLRALGLGAALLVYGLLGNAELSRDARVVAAVATLMAVPHGRWRPLSWPPVPARRITPPCRSAAPLRS
ncbi:MAG: hypothetical protein Q8M01_18500 [Rubrivivax sp.]|nr:hypothetical protein [Rubrivivax sp.]